MYFEDIQLGMTVDIDATVIEKQKMLDFAHTYDPLPLHTDEEYAKQSPFGKLIAPRCDVLYVGVGKISRGRFFWQRATCRQVDQN